MSNFATNLLSISIFHHQTFHSVDDITINMPAIRTASKRKSPPEGFDDIEGPLPSFECPQNNTDKLIDTLLEFQNKLKDAENASHEGRKKHEMLWPVFQITHQRRYHEP